MSTENKISEKELWSKLPNSTGVDKAENLVELSHLAYNRADYKSALALCDNAREIYESLKESVTQQELLHVYEGITWSLRKLKRPADAAQVALNAVEVLREINHGDAMDMLREAGEYFYSAGDYEKSLECHTQAMMEIDPDTFDITTGFDHYSVGFLHQKMGNYPLAITHLQKARQYFKDEKKPEPIYYCDEYLAVCHIALKNGLEALLHAQKALDFADTAEDVAMQVRSRYRLGCVKVLLAEFDDAEKLFKKALSMNVHADPVDWELVVDLEKEIANLLIIKGSLGEADEIQRRIKVLQETLCDA